ncbi:MAG: DNA repair exonuclease [Bacillota bacterium]
MPLKLLHTADLHLGMTFKNRNYPEDVREKLIEARVTTLERLVERANVEKCELMIIAGDLFHRANVASEIIKRTLGILNKFQGCLVLLPGNHDYYDPYGSLWPELSDRASEDFVLLTEKQPYPLHDYGIEAVLYPAPCTAKHSPQNSLEWIRDLQEKPEACWHIGVAHGTVRGISPDFADQYYPMADQELASLGMNTWCLGHTHVRYPDQPEAERMPFLYCGTPEPDGFDCRHGGYAWIVEMDDHGGVFSRAIETGYFRFYELYKQIMSRPDLEQIEHELDSSFDPQATLVKLKLVGSLPEDDYKSRRLLFDRLHEKYVYIEIDDTELTVEITPEFISANYPQASFPHRLLSRLAERNDREALQIAYRLIEEVKQ